MERGVNYIFIGACFMLSLIGFVVFIFWFGESGFFKDEVRIYKSYTKRPLAIKADSLIKYKGINVGRVQSINFKDSNFEEIEITLEIRKDLPVKKDSLVRVEQSGILGASFLALIQNDKSNEFIDDNSEAILRIHSDSALSQVMESIPNITGKVDYLLDNANEMLSEDNAKNVAMILVSINEAMKNINVLAQSLSRNSADIEKIIANVSKIAQSTEQITTAVNAKVAQGEYDLRSTIMPTLMSIERAMGEFEEFAKNANVVMQNLESNPYNTIFGYREEKK